MANQEAFTLDGLALNDQTTFAVDSVSWPPPRQRQDWIGGADSETQLLFRKPKHENRKVTLRVAVIPQTTMDLALAKVAQIVDKLDKAGQYTDGIGLVWTPATATLSCTFDVLAGEITDLPIDWENGWLALAPSFTIELTCKPYARGARVLYGTTTTNSTPLQVLELPSIPGDIAALGELIVTDNATQSRRHVEWGLEGPLTYNNATSLLVDSDDMVTTGFSGAQAVTTGAYDPNATGNNSISLTLVAGGTTALCGTGNLSHVGVFRVKARVQSGSLSNQFRLSWKAADGPMNHNAWVLPIATSGWQELDLGTITIPATVVGTQRWTGQLEVQGATASPGTAVVDYLILVPQADGYGKARSAYAYSVGALGGYDAFTGTVGAAVGARTADLGGSWTTSGDTTDFTLAAVNDGNMVAFRQATASTSGRTAILGAVTYTDMAVEMGVGNPAVGSAATASGGVYARYVDASNYARAAIVRTSTSNTVQVIVVVAGSTVASATSATFALASTGFTPAATLRLIVYATGRAVVQVLDSNTRVASLDLTHSALATGGTLASGKAGMWDFLSGSSTTFRSYDNFAVSTPAPEQITIYSGRNIQFRYDDTLRDDSTGTYTGRPPSYQPAGRFLIPVGTSRVLAKARRNDVVTALDDQVTDSTKIQVAYQPRYLAVPR